MSPEKNDPTKRSWVAAEHYKSLSVSRTPAGNSEVGPNHGVVAIYEPDGRLKANINTPGGIHAIAIH